MPLTTDEAILKTSGAIIDQLHGLFGKHPGFRPAHAKGIILSGTFTPTAEAGQLSKAPHFNAPSTPVWARFSNSTGIPNIPDADPNSSPRGFGLRFHLGPRKHTDVIAHSTPFFPAQNGEQFLALFQAIAATTADSPSPSPVEQFLGAHPAALKFVQAPKPTPISYAADQYWGVSAFKFTNSEGKETFVRWSLVPDVGVQPLEESLLKTVEPDFLQKELVEKLAKGEKIGFKLVAQIAEDGDVITDATVHWPEERKVVVLGSVLLDAVVEDHLKESKNLIFDPIPRVDGIEESDDPLFEMRAAVYLTSGKQRRAA